jgi:hypothetical protein
LGIFFENPSGHPASEEIFFSANWHNEIFPPRKMHEREDLDTYMLGYIFIFSEEKLLEAMHHILFQSAFVDSRPSVTVLSCLVYHSKPTENIQA